MTCGKRLAGHGWLRPGAALTFDDLRVSFPTIRRGGDILVHLEDRLAKTTDPTEVLDVATRLADLYRAVGRNDEASADALERGRRRIDDLLRGRQR